MNDQATDIRSHYNLSEYIAKTLNQEPKREGNWDAFLCPFHGDVRTPDLKVNRKSQYCTCFVCSAVSGGSIIDFVMAYQNVSFQEAVAILSDKRPITLGRGPTKNSNPKPTIDFRPSVEALRPNIGLAEDYFRGRGILELENRLLTLDSGQFFFCNHQYQTLEGLHVFPQALVTPRFIIPDLAYQKVKSVNTRRDDTLCNNLYEEFKELMEVIRIDQGEQRLEKLLAANKRAQKEGKALAPIPYFEDLMPSREEMLDIVFGDKYKCWPGSRRGVFNRARISTEDFQPKPLSYCLVTEGEITALSLEDITPEAGFQAVAAKSLRGLDKAFQGVGQIWVLGEHDTPRVDRRTGETYSASERNIEQLLHAVGRWHDHSAKILYPPKEAGGKSINDFNDFILADRPAAIAYLQEKVPLVGRELLTA